MTTQKRFKTVDVFTDVKYKGNPVTVFFDGDGLTTEEMQAMANWTNLSETTFIVKPTTDKADYKLRIFTPATELPFAGHPTIGSCHAAIEAGVIDGTKNVIVQECAAGLVEMTYDQETKVISFKLPFYKHYALPNAKEDLALVAKALGFPSLDRIKRHTFVNDGPIWFTIQTESAQDVLDLNPNFSELAELTRTKNIPGFCVFGQYPGEKVYEARNFCPDDGINEDPVCGSGAGADGSILAEFEGIEGEIKIRQGRKLGRDGKITVKVVKKDGMSDIFVGGNAITCLDGVY